MRFTLRVTLVCVVAAIASFVLASLVVPQADASRVRDTYAGDHDPHIHDLTISHPNTAIVRGHLMYAHRTSDGRIVRSHRIGGIARVRITDERTGRVWITSTDRSGAYAIRLPLGSYVEGEAVTHDRRHCQGFGDHNIDVTSDHNVLDVGVACD